VSSPVREVVGTWKGADGEVAEVCYDGPSFDAMEAFKPLDKLLKPLTKVSMQMNLDDGTSVDLPFRTIAYMLPDRSGVIAIFEPGQYTHPDGTDVFPKPNNAAIFNADGSLRFQLMLPYGDRIAAFHGGNMPEKFSGMVGLLMAESPRSQPEWVYAVDPNSPTLIDVRQWVRW
jgi:hypothetical protein